MAQSNWKPCGTIGGTGLNIYLGIEGTNSYSLILYSCSSIHFSFFPPYGRPDSEMDWLTVILYYALAFSLAIIVIVDQEKPILLKRIAVYPL